ncbi:hypothetical protein [Psychrobacter sp. H8-1]|uniref:hypothetical protein n=1 Tax=Psychrobacter sp. H8-1 TaxID=2774129 RepID=UPI0019184F96|nr:hypothetical protein [Psychrobacter sp. H8-1]
MNKKKWLTLSVVATALLLIPRRSSRQAMPDHHKPSKKDTVNQPNQAPLNDKDA